MKRSIKARLISEGYSNKTARRIYRAAKQLSQRRLIPISPAVEMIKKELAGVSQLKPHNCCPDREKVRLVWKGQSDMLNEKLGTEDFYDDSSDWPFSEGYKYHDKNNEDIKSCRCPDNFLDQPEAIILQRSLSKTPYADKHMDGIDVIF
jgi:hypothetical protein